MSMRNNRLITHVDRRQYEWVKRQSKINEMTISTYLSRLIWNHQCDVEVGLRQEIIPTGGIYYGENFPKEILDKFKKEPHNNRTRFIKTKVY